MADGSISVRIVGARELRAALLQVDANAANTLTKALGAIAGGIAQKIRGLMPRSSGWAAGTVKAHAKIRVATISEGTGSANDYVPWLDFGGSVGRGHKRGPNMGAIHRDWLGRGVGEGRYIYPQIHAAMPQTLIAIDEAIAEAAQQAGFETSGKL